MKRFTELLSGSAVMLFHAALTGWLFCLAKINSDFQVMSLNYLPLCAALLAAYFLDRLMLHRSVPVPVFIVAQLLFIGLGAWLYTQCVVLQPYKTGSVVMNCIIYCLGFLVADYVAWMPTNENGVLMRFDALAVMLVILLALDKLLALPAAGGAIAMCAVCLLLMLLSSVSMRSGRLAGRGSAVQGDPALGRVVLGAVLGLLAVLAGLVVAYAAGGVKSISEFLLNVINTCISAVKTALLWLYALFERFMLWLTSFMDPGPMGAVGMAPMGGGPEPEIEAGELGAIPFWIYPALIALAAAVLIFVIFRLRRLKVGRVHFASAPVRVEKRSSGLKKALLELFARLKAAVLFRWRCLKNRKTAPALLVWCEGRVDKSLRRRADESGESFLLRLSRCGYGPELSKALESLANCVERSFYSPAPIPVPAEVYKTLKRGKFKMEKTDAN